MRKRTWVRLLAVAICAMMLPFTSAGMAFRSGKVNAEELEPCFAVHHSMELTSKIGLTFYLNLPEGKTPADYPDSYVILEGNKMNSGKLLLSDSTPDDSGEYPFTINFSSIQLADKVTPHFYYGGNEITGTQFSGLDYINKIYSNDMEEQMSYNSDVLGFLSLYCYCAQKYLSEVNGWAIGEKYAEVVKFPSYKMSQIYALLDRTSEFEHRLSDYASETSGIVSFQQVKYRLKYSSALALEVWVIPQDGETLDMDKIFLKDAEGHFHDLNVREGDNGQGVIITFPEIYMNQIGDTYTISFGMNEGEEFSSQPGQYLLKVSPLSSAYAAVSAYLSGSQSTEATYAKDLGLATYCFWFYLAGELPLN